MTDDQVDEAIGRLVLEYRDTCRKESCIRSMIRRACEGMAAIARALEKPERVTPSVKDGKVEGFVIRDGGGHGYDIDALSSNLMALKEVVEKKRRIEEELRAAGLSDVVRIS